MESFSEVVTTSKARSSPLKPMAANAAFAYATTRALSAWPTINKNNASWVMDDKGKTAGIKSILGTDDGFKFGIANVGHSIGTTNQVIGTIRDEAAVEGGVDIMAQIDKRLCESYDIESQDFVDGDLSSVSIEIQCDRDRSTFVVLTNPASQELDDQTLFSAEEAASQGIRRTRWSEPEPYFYQGKHVVVELCSPIRARGIAFVHNPADTTANVFEVAASIEMASSDAPYGDVHYADPGFRGQKRYPIDTAEHVRAAASYFGVEANRAEYTSEQRDHIDAAITAAKKKFGIDDEKSGFSSEDMPSLVPSVSDMLDDYTDVDPVVPTTGDDLPNKAYADEDSGSLTHPLYASAEKYAQGQPHAGMVKAALQAHGTMKNQNVALKRLQVAHSQLHGAKSMEKAEQLATEVAALTAKLDEAKTSIEQANTTIDETKAAVAAKDEEIATLTKQVKDMADEKAALEAKIADKEAEEKASARLAKLSEIEGFTVKDDEKAALIEALKTEEEMAFENRVLKAKVASMEEASKKEAEAKQKADDEKAAADLADETAAALGDLDIVPKAFSGKEAKILV